MTQQPSERARPSPTIRVGVLGLCAAFLLVLPLALAPRAEAYIYWTTDSGAIGRANLDGTGIDESFVVAPGVTPDVAVGARHLYWTESLPIGFQFMIERAKLDGTGPERTVDRIVVGPAAAGAPVRDVTVGGKHIYWAWEDIGPAPNDTYGIGRANLDGSAVDRTFIGPTIVNVSGGYPFLTVAVDRSHIYWTYLDWTYLDSGLIASYGIARANLDGTGVDRTFITGLDRAVDLTVEGEHLYWVRNPDISPPNTGPPTGTIGRASIDGTGVEENFFSPAPATDDRTGGEARVPPAVVDAYRIEAIAIDDRHIYWTSEDGAIGRANLDGSQVDQRLIAGAEPAGGLAVDGGSAELSGKASAKRRQGQPGRRIRVKVKIRARDEALTARGQGAIRAGRKSYQLQSRTIHLSDAQAKFLRLKPRRAGASGNVARALRRERRVIAKVSVKLTDKYGNTETEKLRVRLRR